MAKTKQGAFDEVYHHIDAPTVQDDEYGKQFKKRKLIVPDMGQGEAYRSPLLAYMAELPWVYARKWDGEQALWNGKSNNFQCSAEFTDFMNNTFIEEIFEEKFGRDKTVILFGEKMGPKTQGNELGLKEDTFVLFDINVNGTWLSGVSIVEIAGYFGVPSVYRFMPHGQAPTPLRELINKCARGDFKDWEGIVAKPLVECKDYKGNRVIVKIKNRDYLRGE